MLWIYYYNKHKSYGQGKNVLADDLLKDVLR